MKLVQGLAALLTITQLEAAAPLVITGRGICDASAVALLGSEHFVVADDEDNLLRVYSRTQGGLPLHTFDLSPFLQLQPKAPEVDLEGAAPLGDRVYWISSHGRNKDGKARPNRQRFFATTHSKRNSGVVIESVGRPYRDLLSDLLKDARLKPFGLAAAATRAPKAKDALNIEGLAATPEGHLLIGFRNPIPHGQALIVPLLNPAEVIEGQRARLGDPLLLDLDGRGIRSLARAQDRYLIIAGHYDGGGQSALYEWRGGDEPPRRLPHIPLAGLNPEAIEIVAEDGVERLLVVSDDGNRQIAGQECKTLGNPELKNFRALTTDF